MIIKLFDRTELSVGKEEGEKLKASLERSAEGMVSINGFMIKKSAIAYIKPGGYTEADMADLDVQQKLRGTDAMRRVGSGTPAGIGELMVRRKNNNKE